MTPFEGASRHGIMHHHMLGVLATELPLRARPGEPLRILDMGCGNGQLMAFLQSFLPTLLPGQAVELHGFDVDDSKVQKSDFFDGTLRLLREAHPGVAWERRLGRIGSGEAWPHAADAFDAVISNQVMEHVRDHAGAFASIARVLRPDGLSVHLFPLRSSWMEWHLKMPFAHWVENGDLSYRYIRAASWLGWGTWRAYCRRVAPIDLDTFARMNRDFLAFETNYLTPRELSRLARAAGLRHSYRYTRDLYANRLRIALGQPVRHQLRPPGGLLERVGLAAYQRISSICLVLERDNRYENRGFHTP